MIHLPSDFNLINKLNKIFTSEVVSAEVGSSKIKILAFWERAFAISVNCCCPVVKLFNFLHDIHSLFETVIVAANDKLVESFLNNKIKFTDIQKKLFKIIKKKF